MQKLSNVLARMCIEFTLHFCSAIMHCFEYMVTMLLWRDIKMFYIPKRGALKFVIEKVGTKM